LDDDSDVGSEPTQTQPSAVAPLLRKLMADYAATGLPPAYLADHRGGGDADVVQERETDDEESER
jgi:hypothetical protein